ncbi:rho gtpase-activating protein 32-like [Lichtheimia corymbifera JMRC:FSU:9682]|uniref:Rho gtpase-activating protein 32-like n=1 Tax=Lichtheimia corymbifera JMRC:FSU:9682 TaxID=1263082 RepID=A0A068RFC6_9FUNG|nr:rho gtpase-activating protein 32-like [Lichtheimia corymbifera JMRC:FSU:9682]
MVQYLIAVWDYAAEGEFELSFRQGDRIKLLEKHNDDWWEGELNDEIGFFPANRIRLETEHEEQLAEQQQQQHAFTGNDTTIYQQQPSLISTDIGNGAMPTESEKPALPPRDIRNRTSYIAPRESLDELPEGWQHAYDDNGTIYYFNDRTGESRWDKPSHVEGAANQLASMALSPPPPSSSSVVPNEDIELEQEGLRKLNPAEKSQLELNHLQPEWIRQQGFIQMKMTAEKEEGGKLSSWKFYYAVLSRGFLLLYKDNYSKAKKYAKPLIPVGCFDLDGCRIEPASKQDTKRKHAFLITTLKKVTIYIQTSSDKELSVWLDAIMRELVARKERVDGDSEILRLLHSLTSDSDQMKVNRKMDRKKDVDDKDWKHRSRSEGGGSGGGDDKGRPKRLGNWFAKQSKAGDKLQAQAVAGSTSINTTAGTDVFGGYLTMDRDGGIPPVVRACVEEVEARGVASVGIYRLSGPASIIQKYRALFNSNEFVSFPEDLDINAVTGLLKLYFRELKNPLMTHEYYDYFMDAARIPDYDERMFRIKSVIHALPGPNYTVLEYLMRHLNHVAAYCEINKMETSNLALIFSVGLLRPEGDDLSSIMQTDLQSKVVEAIIQQVDWFFEVDDEDTDQNEIEDNHNHPQSEHVAM